MSQSNLDETEIQRLNRRQGRRRQKSKASSNSERTADSFVISQRGNEIEDADSE
jgi:hypothetical protein